MAIGIAGDTAAAGLIGGLPAESVTVIELRTISNVLQSMLGYLSAPTPTGLDELNVLRNDQAFELGLPQPVPGSNT